MSPIYCSAMRPHQVAGATHALVGLTRPQHAITLDDLLAKAQHLQDITYATKEPLISSNDVATIRRITYRAQGYDSDNGVPTGSRGQEADHHGATGTIAVAVLALLRSSLDVTADLTMFTAELSSEQLIAATNVKAGPGINENGSSAVAFLEIAQQLTSEDDGLWDFYFYTDTLSAEEAARIRLYLHIDMMASPNDFAGDHEGDDMATRASSTSTGGLFSGAEGRKTEVEAALYGGVAGAAYGVNYHKAGDDVANLSRECFIQMSHTIAHSVATYGSSWDGFSEREHPRNGNIIDEKEKK
ncbi:hypothetical protein Micbo1qcDRAFT_173412 [Microdochium bolleyi]|uniref:Uncharacterized protein n=1 Tax=Microdochium bolleyi TaxID=196109 RepID=A0A136JC35_9PEZI|nr:hypothetical protein Micbo1qcDRAFT_173412 [Microdochium bolleyi]